VEPNALKSKSHANSQDLIPPMELFDGKTRENLTALQSRLFHIFCLEVTMSKPSSFTLFKNRVVIKSVCPHHTTV